MCELTLGCDRESGSATTSGAAGIGGCSCNIVHTFHGGSLQKLLARTKLVPYPGDQRQLLVCAGDEASSAVSVGSVSMRDMFYRSRVAYVGLGKWRFVSAPLEILRYFVEQNYPVRDENNQMSLNLPS